MAVKIIRKAGLTWRIELTNLKSYYKAYKEFFEKGGIARTAKYLQKQAWLVMKAQYMSTKSGRTYYNKKYISKPLNKKIEFRLFAHQPNLITQISKTAYDIRYIEDLRTLSKDLPHLQWQEEGTKRMVDRQPYLIINGKLMPITKKKAFNRKRNLRGTGRHSNIVILDVSHPSLRARRFIKAAQFFLKEKGAKVASDFVKEELSRLRGK